MTGVKLQNYGKSIKTSDLLLFWATLETARTRETGWYHELCNHFLFCIPLAFPIYLLVSFHRWKLSKQILAEALARRVQGNGPKTILGVAVSLSAFQLIEYYQSMVKDDKERAKRGVVGGFEEPQLQLQLLPIVSTHWKPLSPSSD